MNILCIFFTGSDKSPFSFMPTALSCDEDTLDKLVGKCVKDRPGYEGQYPVYDSDEGQTIDLFSGESGPPPPGKALESGGVSLMKIM